MEGAILWVSIWIDIGAASIKSKFETLYITENFTFSRVVFHLVWMVHIGMEHVVAVMWTLIKGFEIVGLG